MQNQQEFPGTAFLGREGLRDEPPAAPLSPATRGFDPDALTRALRIAGAALVVASASTFMLQHWQGGNDLIRYAMLVGQSLLLAAAAYFVGLSMQEGRSARTFLALVLATMLTLAKQEPRIAELLADKTIAKEFVVPGRLISIVVK